MIYLAGELLAHLNNLQLVGQDEEGDLEWMGEQKDFNRMKEDLKKYYV